MIQVKKIFKGTHGRVWFVQDNKEETIWAWDPANQKGMDGNIVWFGLIVGSGFCLISVVGPWCSNKEAMQKDTEWSDK